MDDWIGMIRDVRAAVVDAPGLILYELGLGGTFHVVGAVPSDQTE